MALSNTPTSIALGAFASRDELAEARRAERRAGETESTPLIQSGAIADTDISGLTYQQALAKLGITDYAVQSGKGFPGLPSGTSESARAFNAMSDEQKLPVYKAEQLRAQLQMLNPDLSSMQKQGIANDTLAPLQQKISAIEKVVIQPIKEAPKDDPSTPEDESKMIDDEILSNDQLIRLNKQRQAALDAGNTQLADRIGQTIQRIESRLGGGTTTPGSYGTTQERLDADRAAIKPLTTGINTPGGTQAATVGTQDQQAKLQAAKEFLQNSGLPQDVLMIFDDILEGYDTNKDINMQAIVDEFKRFQSTTLSPALAEKAKIFTDELTRAGTSLAEQRVLELEAEGVKASEAIRGEQGKLEQRGLIFSGEARRQLGETSASMAPRFGGEVEGLIPQQNRLIATSTAARDRAEREKLARAAETTLGSAASGQLGYGVTQLGGVTGELEKERVASEKAYATGVYNQEIQNVVAREPITTSLTNT